MLIVSNVILDWLAEDGFSLGESSWVHAAKVVNLGRLIGYPLDE